MLGYSSKCGILNPIHLNEINDTCIQQELDRSTGVGAELQRLDSSYASNPYFIADVSLRRETHFPPMAKKSHIGALSHYLIRLYCIRRYMKHYLIIDVV